MSIRRVYGASAVVFLMVVVAFSSTASAAIAGQDSERLGTSLVGLGDQDADGFEELAAGAPGASNGAAGEAGAVYVFRGAVDFEILSLTSANADLVIRGITANGHLGQSVGATDFNGNGKLELLVGEPDSAEGRVYVIPDSLIASQMAGDKLIQVNEQGVGIITIKGESVGDRFGAALQQRTADADGDGRGDLLVGAPQRTGPRTTLYDGWEDGEYSQGIAWTQHDGNLRVENGELRQVAGGSESISTPSTQAYGAWEVKFRHGIDSGYYNSILRFYFIGNDGAFGPGSSTAKGYYLFANTIYSPDLVCLYRDDGGSSSNVFAIGCTQNYDVVWPAQNDLKVVRYPNNHFHVFLNGIKILSGTDSTYTTSKFIGFRNSADTSASSVFVDWLKASTLAPENLFDDFDDESLAANPTWTEYPANTWSASSLELRQTVTGAARISAPADLNDGTWSARFKHGTDLSTTNSILRFYLYFKDAVDPGDTSTIDGYYIYSNSKDDVLSLVKQVNGVITALVSTTWADDTIYHEVKVIRNSGNYWQVYLDGQFRMDYSETTSTGAITTPGSGMRIGFRNQADTTTAIVKVDDVKTPEGLTQHGASYLLLARETLNNRNAGTSDLIRFGTRTNDHFGSAVSTSSVADLLVGAPDADFCCKAADSGFAEFVRGASLEKVAYFNDFDGTEYGVNTGGAWGPAPNTEWELGTPVQNAQVFDNPDGDHTTGAGNAWGTDLDNFYSISYGDQNLFSPTFDLTNMSGARLVMWHAYWVEADYDYIRVSATKNGGVTYTELYATTDHSPLEPPLTGELTWTRLVVPLTGFTGVGTSQVQLRFTLDQDAVYVANGWYVDDVAIVGRYPAQLDTVSLQGTNGERFGAAVGLEDISADGIPDAAIGAPSAYSGTGRVATIRGPVSASSLKGEVTGSSTSAGLGSAVLAVPDVNLDGNGDLLLGAPNGGTLGGGAAYFVAGTPAITQPPATPLSSAFFMREFDPGQLGGSSFGVTDANGDGFLEPLIGGPGPVPPGTLPNGAVFSTPPPGTTDIDNDGLTSSSERHVYGTDPFDADSDDDGMLDGTEKQYWDAHPTSEWYSNTDADSLYNLVDPDSDNDGLLDGFLDLDGDMAYDNNGDGVYDPEDEFGEVLGWYIPSSSGPRLVTSDPANPNTDGDGMNDYQEYLAQTDPFATGASDMDGLTDAYEMSAVYNLEQFGFHFGLEGWHAMQTNNAWSWDVAGTICPTGSPQRNLCATNTGTQLYNDIYSPKLSFRYETFISFSYFVKDDPTSTDDVPFELRVREIIGGRDVKLWEHPKGTSTNGWVRVWNVPVPASMWFSETHVLFFGGSVLVGDFVAVDDVYVSGRTHPSIDDTDGDRLKDGWSDFGVSGNDNVWQPAEVKGEVGQPDAAFAGGHRTDPVHVDTDDDGINDYYETTWQQSTDRNKFDFDSSDDQVRAVRGWSSYTGSAGTLAWFPLRDGYGYSWYVDHTVSAQRSILESPPILLGDRQYGRNVVNFELQIENADNGQPIDTALNLIIAEAANPTNAQTLKTYDERTSTTTLAAIEIPSGWDGMRVIFIFDVFFVGSDAYIMDDFSVGWFTDPNRPDTDLDGIVDGFVDVNKNHVWDDGTDTPGESGQWFAGYRWPLNSGHPCTVSVLADTDLDTLADSQEDGFGRYISAAKPGTNPCDSDTDGDGLRDDKEDDFGSAGLSPLKFDFNRWTPANSDATMAYSPFDFGGAAAAGAYLDSDESVDLILGAFETFPDHKLTFRTGKLVWWAGASGYVTLDAGRRDVQLPTVTFYETRGMGVAFGYLNIDPDYREDAIFMALGTQSGITNPGSLIEYRILYDVGSSGESWSSAFTLSDSIGDPIDFGREPRDGGVAVGYFDGNIYPDAIFMVYDADLSSPSRGLKYVYAHDLNPQTGEFATVSDIIDEAAQTGNIGIDRDSVQGADVAVYDVDRDGDLDAVFLIVDDGYGTASDSENTYRYVVCEDFRPDYKFERCGDTRAYMPVRGHQSKGGGLVATAPNRQVVFGVSATDFDSNGFSDALFVHRDPGEEYRHRIAWDQGILEPNKGDTDADGLWDGWRDEPSEKEDPTDQDHTMGEITWSSGEKVGEIGDITQTDPVTGAPKGSVATILPAGSGSDDLPRPLTKDIYVEVDWMASKRDWNDPTFILLCGGVDDIQNVFNIGGWVAGALAAAEKGPQCAAAYIVAIEVVDHKFPDSERGNIIDLYKRRGIRLHLDTGSLGGGQELSFYEAVDAYWTSGQAGHVPYDTLYDNYFLLTPSGQQSSRKGVFRYAVFAHRGVYPDGSENFAGVVPFLGSDKILEIPDKHWTSNVGKASTFIHELGHLLYLDADYLWANSDPCNLPCSSWPHPPISASDLPSAMRYGRQEGEAGYLDYSDREGQRVFYFDRPNSTPENRVYDTNEWAYVSLTGILNT